MRRLVLGFMAGILLFFGTADRSPGGEESAGKMSLDRIMDQVVLKGEKLGAVRGRPIKALRLMAFRAGKLEVIPFQIDEVTPAGDYVMLRPAGKNDQDTDEGIFDENDELVFMAKDAGDRGKPAEAGLSAGNWEEIELHDPGTHGRGWVYMVAFEGEPPPLSPLRYMRYEEKADHDSVITPYYTLHFPKNNVFMDAVIIHPGAGGSGLDIMDRIKMRTEVAMLSGAVKVDKTEENFVHKVLGHLAGPVRVIRQTETRLTLVLNLKSPAAVVNGSFYPTCFQFPSVLSLPFRMDLIASDASIRQGWDLTRNALGLKFYSNLNRAPVVMDGVMSEEEKKLAQSQETLLWALLTGPPGTFIFKGVWEREKAPIKALLYYEDDLSRAEPPEEESGVMGFAYRLEDLLKMGGEEYPFNIVNYIVPDFDGNIERALRVFDHPLEVKVNP